ncbi:MAG: hypothetical protein R3B45_16035 [Bdellovibrionota bacterium]
MGCNRCPHHVRHGKLADDKKTVEFKNLCGLKIKQGQEHDPEVNTKPRGRGRPVSEPVKRAPLAPGETYDCVKYPFTRESDYFQCEVYILNFRTKGLRNGVMPTKDFQYSESFSGGHITDMELL